MQVTRPALEFVAPYQTVCNYLVYFFNPLGTHQSAAVAGGTTERILAKLVDTTPGELARHAPSRPSRWTSRRTRTRRQSPRKQSLHTQYGGPAIDSSGRADCQGGQTGYPYRLVPTRATAGRSAAASSAAAASCVDGDTPGLAGGTFKSRELGIDHLEDVP